MYVGPGPELSKSLVVMRARKSISNRSLFTSVALRTGDARLLARVLGRDSVKAAAQGGEEVG